MDYTHIPTISCFYSEESKHSLLNPEAHFEYEMILVTGGRADCIINHQHYELHKKSLLFISRLERHSFILQETPYQRYVASMSGDLILSSIRDVELTSVFLQRPKGFCHVLTLSDRAYDMLLPLFARMAEEFAAKRAFYVSRSTSLVVAILIDLFRTHPEFFPLRSHSNISNAVLSAQRYVNDHFAEKITLQGIAEENFLSRHTLSLAFKDIVGIPFKEYLVLFRITEAKKLLITTDFSVEEIAERVGYDNVNNFIRIFKSREAVTPLRYRRQFGDRSK